MSDVKTLVQGVLEDILAKGAGSATLATRDGLPVVHRTHTGAHPDTFAAMAAALLGAGEAAMLELGHSDVQHALIESPSQSLGVVGVDDGFLLVAAAKDRDTLLSLFNEGVPKLKEILTQ